MNTERVERQFDDITRGLRCDDGDFVRRLVRLRRRASVRVGLVVALLFAALVLLAAGLALLSPVAWVAGVGAFVAASCVDTLLRVT
jgi:hypothetical protein